VLLLSMASVEPSGAACAAISVATMPPWRWRASTITRSSATPLRRDQAGGEIDGPPATDGTSSRTGFAGNSCAQTTSAQKKSGNYGPTGKRAPCCALS
jgi:hypothetical protein